mgnify:CR=1 FL=1
MHQRQEIVNEYNRGNNGYREAVSKLKPYMKNSPCTDR